MDLDTLIEQLTENCSAIAKSEDSDAPLELPFDVDMDKVWPLLLDLGREDPKCIDVLMPLLTLFAGKVESVRSKTYDACASDLAIMADQERPFDERLEASLGLIRFLPVLSPEMIGKVVDETINLFDAFVKASPDVVLPTKLIDAVGEIDVEELEPPETAQSVIEKLRAAIGGEKRVAGMLMFGCKAHELLELVVENEELSKFVMETISESLTSDVRELRVAGCFITGQVCQHWTHCDPEEVPSPEKMFDLLKPLMTCDDELVGKHAHKVFRALIGCELFNNEATLAKVFEMFPMYRKERMPRYFKVLSTFVYPDECDDCCSCCEEDEHEHEVKLEIVQPIVDWVQEHLRSSDDFVIALCLDLIGDLAFKDKMYVEDYYDEGLGAAMRLVDQQVWETFEYVANFLIAMNQNFKEETEDRVAPLITPIVMSLFKEETGNLKHRVYTAAALAQMVADGTAKEEAPALIRFAIETLNDDNEELLFKLCTVMMPLKACYDDETANAVFAKLVTRVCETKDDGCVSSWCHLMAKLLKRYTINEDVVNSVIAAILSGSLKILHGRPPHKSLPPNTSLFAFLACYIKKSPSKAKPICEQVIEWIGYTAFQAIPSLMIPIKAGVSVGIVDQPLAAKLAPVIKGLLKKLATDDVEELVAVTEVTTELFTHHPETLEPASELVNLFAQFVKAADPDKAEEEDFEEMNDIVEAMPAVAQLVFSIYGSNNAPEEINEEVLTILVNMLPFPPGVEEMSDLLELLCAVLEDADKYECILLPALKMFTEVLLMKKSDLDEYEFSDELIKEMKTTLKTHVKGNKKLEAAITKDFRKQRAKLNRFNSFIR